MVRLLGICSLQMVIDRLGNKRALELTPKVWETNRLETYLYKKPFYLAT